MRLAARRACLHRKPYTLAVDEFEHIGILASEEEINAHMHCAKSFINESKVPWTAFGTYEMTDFLEINDQLSQRDKIIHFPRYRLEADEDVAEFKRVLEQLLRRMPLQRTPQLNNKLFELCYVGSIGKIGTLINWLINAYDLCLSEEAKTLSCTHLEETIKPEFELEKMLVEAENGETKLMRSEDKRKAFRIRLGFEKGTGVPPTQSNSSTLPPTSEPSATPASDPKKKTGSNRRKSRVGKRLPKRDSVGEKPA
ncbi:TniB family NTP-binding protein [Stenomitos frigidus]|uniref:TniB family NTP-binding protein n=1 Tax=Stenomitos frigidus TaxID=1886765 RepID=UPI0015E7449E